MQFLHAIILGPSTTEAPKLFPASNILVTFYDCLKTADAGIGGLFRSRCVSVRLSAALCIVAKKCKIDL